MYKLILSGLSLIPIKTHKKLIYLQVFFLITAIVELITIYSIGPAVAIFINDDFIRNDKFINFLVFFNLQDILEEPLLIKIFLPLFFLIFFIISQFLVYYSIKFSLKMSYGIATSLSNNLYFNGLKKKISELSDLNTNRIILLLTEETDRFIYSCVMFFLRIISRILVMFVFFISFVFINFQLSILITFFLIGYYFFFYKKIEKRLYENGKNITELSFKKIKTINETFTNFREVNVFNLKNNLLHDMIKINNSLNDAKFINSSITLLPKYVLETFLIFLTMIIGLTNLVFFHQQNLSEYFIMIIILIFAGYKLIPTFQEIFVGASVLRSLNYTILKLKDHNKENINLSEFEKKINKNINFESLELTNINFGYSPSNLLFEKFNLKVVRGEKVCLLGESGSGKSTLLDIILGFRMPEKGKIFLNNNLITDILGDNDLKNLVSYVPQKVLLLDKSILENITLNDKKFDEFRLDRAIKLAHIEKFINESDNGINSNVGELGKNVSGGQAQRIALARSIYRDTPIMILDEPTSSLDNKTSSEILKNLSKLDNKTIIMSSHKVEEIKELKFKIITL